MKRNHEVRVKLSQEELGIIKTKAKSLGMATSSFLRVIALKANLVPS